jgi:uncharacterized protein
MRKRTIGHRRPRVVVGYQSWRSMLFLHWRVEEEELRRRIPPELNIDTFEGQAYVGIVAFGVARTRPRGLPNVPLLAPALELNVRTYVRTPHGPPGIYFLSLDTNRLAYAASARLLLRNTTHWARATHEDGAYRFERRSLLHPTSFQAKVREREILGVAETGSLEHFLLERYVMYAQHPRDLARVRIQHQPYELRSVEVESLREDFVEAVGISREGELASALASPGVDVRIYAPERVEPEELLIHADDPADDMVREGDGHARRPAHWIT